MDEKGFEPQILVFCCNWCAYASADLSGTARLQYPPGVRIVRVMCAGRVDPYLVLRAFERGFDGVMIAGCHLGDCHYLSGNEKAEQRVLMLKELLGVIGIEPGRLKILFVSAAEGGKFAKEVTGFVEEIKRIGKNEIRVEKPKAKLKDLDTIIADTAVYYCAECGKCTSICPVSEVKDFSPRVTVGNAIFGFDTDVEQVAFDCLTCGRCKDVCPAVVDYPEFTRQVRRKMLLEGYEARPTHGNLFLSSARIMAQTEIDGRFRRALFEGLKTSSKGDVVYFTGCSPLYQFLFKEVGCSLDNPLERIGDDVARIPRDAVFLMNKAGVAPVILEQEKCCGHDLYWIGDDENFETLARYNTSLMKDAGAKRVVCSCPEGYWIMKQKYPKVTDFDLEVLHISEFLQEQVEKGTLILRLGENGKEPRKKVTYQDPCRLGKYLGVYDAPRFLLEEAGFEVAEMAHSRDIANCCGGPNAWVGCGSANRMMQLDRLEEATATKSEVLVTSCPKCQAHLKCGQCGELPAGRDVEIEIKDLVTILAEAVREAE
ncbi:MAG: hydrogenase iron-sulfur subunit [Methanomicrobia archaeon]|nr:hydrogenase iron-sulfur subunit [Methanomicrobia archaeon]